MRCLVAVVLSAATACAMGAPPGFSEGTSWTLPLVDPLADGRLITPVFIDDRGPYLFLIDPDAPITAVDRSIVVESGRFRIESGPRLVDEQDTSHPTLLAEVTRLRAGDLTKSLNTVRVSRDHAFDTDDRRIHGVLGRDIVADSIVFGFDRDRGIAWLQTQESFRAPADAQILSYSTVHPQHDGPVLRRITTANVDGSQLDLHLDLGDVRSQLAAPHARAAALGAMPLYATLVDEVGTRRAVSTAHVARRVTLGGVTADRHPFVPFDDRRWTWNQVDGTLGLDFFQPFSVAANWHRKRVYLTVRRDQRDLRLARWGEAVPSACRATGCVAIDVALATAGGEPREHLAAPGMAPSAPRRGATAHATVRRDPAAAGLPLQVVLAATTVAGSPLPGLVIDLPASADAIAIPVEPRYVGATFAVRDASPFPRGPFDR